MMRWYINNNIHVTQSEIYEGKHFVLALQRNEINQKDLPIKVTPIFCLTKFEPSNGDSTILNKILAWHGHFYISIFHNVFYAAKNDHLFIISMPHFLACSSGILLILLFSVMKITIGNIKGWLEKPLPFTLQWILKGNR